MPRAARAAFPLLLVTLGACEVADDPTSPAVPQAPAPTLAIFDGSQGGNQHFYFLPPLVPNPSYAGSFDGTLSPVVEICELAGPACGPVVASFGVQELTADLSAEVYQAVWHTKESGLDESKTYRIQVFLGNVLLGFADADVVANGSGKSEVNTDDFVVVKNGSTLPIRFRIEEGVLAGLFTTISAGGFHSCGLTPTGDAYCWGGNSFGQLGDGNAGTSSDTPVPVLGGHSFQSIVAGGNHTCGLALGGGAYCWGSNLEGELGDGNGGTSSDIPVPVSGGQLFQSISAGWDHTCGLTPGGDAYCWGENLYGGLGDGNAPTDSDTPVLVVGGHAFQSISAGGVHTCGVISGGDAYCWGNNGHGRLGNGNAPTDSDVPVPVSGGHVFGSISAGGHHTCGLTSGGSAYCWGRNFSGTLGDGNLPTHSDVPVPVSGGHAFQSISAGDGQSCGLVSGGDAYCWGDNTAGQLGVGNTPSFTDLAILVSGGHSFQAITAGISHTCGVSAVGVGRCWGFNQDGQLGDGNAPNSSDTPALVAFP